LWENEEFLIISPETELNGAQQLAEKIRQKIASLKFPIIGNTSSSFVIANFHQNDNKDYRITC